MIQGCIIYQPDTNMLQSFIIFTIPYLPSHQLLAMDAVWFNETVLPNHSPFIHCLSAVKMSLLISEHICSFKQFVRNAPSLFCTWKMLPTFKNLCVLFCSFLCSLTYLLRPSSRALTDSYCKAFSYIACLI